MPLKPSLRPLVALAGRLGDSGSPVPIPVQRRVDARLLRLLGPLVIRRGHRMTSVTHEMIPVSGGRILVRLYRPHEGTLPLHVFLHGGGFCMGNLDERDARCQDLAAEAGCVVASVDYRLAPENRYPTAPEDAYAALCWLVDHAGQIGIEPAVVSIGGESAGATLAAVVCLMTRDRSGPPLVFQVLEVPGTDLTLSQPSIADPTNRYPPTLSALRTFMDCYFEDPTQATEPYASPLFASDVRGLPPAWIMTSEYDLLRSDGEAYAKKLAEGDVPVELKLLSGHIHASFAFTRLTSSARRYQRSAAIALRAAHARALEQRSTA
jgi:acetyl esterase